MASWPDSYSLLPGHLIQVRFLLSKFFIMLQFNDTTAKRIGDELGVDWRVVDLEEFNKGINFELEHRQKIQKALVTHDHLHELAKTAWKHLKEIPDYYTRLGIMEKKAEAFWNEVNSMSWKVDHP